MFCIDCGAWTKHGMPRKLKAECPRMFKNYYARRCVRRLARGLYPVPGRDDPINFQLIDGRIYGGRLACQPWLLPLQQQQQALLAIEDGHPGGGHPRPGLEPVLLAIQDGEA
eukprot:9468584-Pyramimonas_sp.AAC.2